MHADGSLRAALDKLGDELRFVLITSAARVAPLADAPADAPTAEVGGERLAIAATAATGEKCARCWHRLPDVGTHDAHPELCGRCVANVDGAGETRRIA